MTAVPAIALGLLGALSVAVIPAPARTDTMARRHDVGDEAYLEAGARPEYAPVGAIRLGARHDGSVVLVDTEWVLTDAHVLSDQVDGRTVVRPLDSLSVHLEGVRYAVREVVVHPGYWAQANAGDPEILKRRGVDVALVRLDRPVDGITPLPLPQRDPAPGTLLTFVGFGRSGTAQSVVTSPVSDARRRAGTNTLDQVGGMVGPRHVPEYLLVGDFDHPTDRRFNKTGDATATAREAQPVGGDSGGAMIAMVDGRPTVVGLFVTGTISINDRAEDGIYGSVWYGTSTAFLRPWIGEVLRGRRP